MDQDISLYHVPLSWLTNESLKILSNLLNATKILPSDGPGNLPRYWVGLASLANISTETAGNIALYSDKTAKLLEIWIRDNPNTAYVGFLLEFLQHLDRYDVYDDCVELHKQGKLFAKPHGYPVRLSVEVPEDDRLITYEDKECGEPQFYHAYVVHAPEDKDFVDTLLSKMREAGLRLCTKDNLLPGHVTQYAPVSRLISERCQRIILVYSPDFLRSPENSFYTNYAQAIGIERKQLKIIPLLYRDCELPPQVSYYHKLYYTPPGPKATYDIWKKLSDTLNNTPRLNNAKHSTVKIREVLTSNSIFSSNSTFEPRNLAIENATNKTEYLEIPSITPRKSISISGLDTCEKSVSDDSKSLSNLSQLSECTQKKSNKYRNFISYFKKKKSKKALAAMDG